LCCCCSIVGIEVVGIDVVGIDVVGTCIIDVGGETGFSC